MRRMRLTLSNWFYLTFCDFPDICERNCVNFIIALPFAIWIFYCSKSMRYTIKALTSFVWSLFYAETSRIARPTIRSLSSRSPRPMTSSIRAVRFAFGIFCDGKKYSNASNNHTSWWQNLAKTARASTEGIVRIVAICGYCCEWLERAHSDHGSGRANLCKLTRYLAFNRL